MISAAVLAAGTNTSRRNFATGYVCVRPRRSLLMAKPVPKRRHDSRSGAPLWLRRTPVRLSLNTASISVEPFRDSVPRNSPGTVEISFDIPDRYNASEVLFQNALEERAARVAVIGPAGERTYAQLCTDAARWGNAFSSLGLVRGDRILCCSMTRRIIRRHFLARCARVRSTSR
jgi:hypothetical protein